MANRRMFSKDIVRSDAFLDLPISSQALYFHLGMEADDRGYVNNPKAVIRNTGAALGDLEQLANKRFVLIRGESLILIKGWRINNCIQPSRLVESKFVDDLEKLFFDENDSYTDKPTEKPVLGICRQNVDKMSTTCQQNVDKTLTNCQQNVDNLSTQDRIGKDSIGFRIYIDKTDKKDKTTVDTAENEPNLVLGHHALTKLLIRTNYLEPDEINLDDYDRLFEWLLKNYETGKIAVAVKYITSKARLKEIDSKFAYFRKAIFESLAKDYGAKAKKNPGDAQEITQADIDQLLNELGDD